MKRFLVALDSSARAPSVVSAAGELAQALGATLIPFRVVHVPQEFPAAGGGGHPDGLPRFLHDQALAELSTLMSTAPQDRCASPVVVVDSHPWKAILESAALMRVDLIVMGSHGHTPVDVILGTTAAKVANLAKTNVLVVHAQPQSP